MKKYNYYGYSYFYKMSFDLIAFVKRKFHLARVFCHNIISEFLTSFLITIVSPSNTMLIPVCLKYDRYVNFIKTRSNKNKRKKKIHSDNRLYICGLGNKAYIQQIFKTRAIMLCVEGSLQWALAKRFCFWNSAVRWWALLRPGAD